MQGCPWEIRGHNGRRVLRFQGKTVPAEVKLAGTDTALTLLTTYGLIF